MALKSNKNLKNMKQKIFTTIPVLLAALLISVSVNAQRDGRGDRRYDDDRNGRRYEESGRGRNDDRYDGRRGDNRGRGGYIRYNVRERPIAPRYVQPRRPSSVHIWIDGGWQWNRGQYVYQAGYWTMPRQREVWVPGYWERSRGGWCWIEGYWAPGRGRW
jgi:hypothetical protein